MIVYILAFDVNDSIKNYFENDACLKWKLISKYVFLYIA